MGLISRVSSRTYRHVLDPIMTKADFTAWCNEKFSNAINAIKSSNSQDHNSNYNNNTQKKSSTSKSCIDDDDDDFSSSSSSNFRENNTTEQSSSVQQNEIASNERIKITPNFLEHVVSVENFAELPPSPRETNTQDRTADTTLQTTLETVPNSSTVNFSEPRTPADEIRPKYSRSVENQLDNSLNKNKTSSKNDSSKNNSSKHDSSKILQ